MKRGLLALAALTMLFASTGCHHNTCNHCGHGGLAGNQHHRGGADHVPRVPHHAAEMAMQGPAGPPAAATAYPYYSNRAPRDFLLDNPPSIGY